jgi:hypothetical protein
MQQLSTCRHAGAAMFNILRCLLTVSKNLKHERQWKVNDGGYKQAARGLVRAIARKTQSVVGEA